MAGEAPPWGAIKIWLLIGRRGRRGSGDDPAIGVCAGHPAVGAFLLPGMAWPSVAIPKFDLNLKKVLARKK